MTDIYEPVGALPDLTHTDAKFKVGQPGKGADNTEWLYVQASGAITQYDVVAIDEDYTARRATPALAATGHVPAFAQIAFSDDEYGWVATNGSNINVRAAGSTSADARLYIGGTSASDGVVLDTNTGGTELQGVVTVTANNTTATNSVEIIAHNPHFLA